LPEVSWLFLQGANEDPYLDDTGRESNAEKQPTGSGPEGCDVGEASRFALSGRSKAGTLRLRGLAGGPF
jgi:hypothetical protein